MEEITGLYEKKIDTLLSKMFGDSQSELKIVTKLSLMNNILTEDMKRTLIDLREKSIKEAKMINDELSMTLDANGNLVEIVSKDESPSVAEKMTSPRQQDMKILYQDN
jgi:hypothetical protein